MDRDKVSLETQLEYNCDRCEVYWEPLRKYWKGLGRHIQYVKLYCPACKRTKRREW